MTIIIPTISRYNYNESISKVNKWKYIEYLSLNIYELECHKCNKGVVGGLACVNVTSLVVEGWGSGVTHGSSCISSLRQKKTVISVIKWYWED